ncbi:MAG: hypothetical protein HZC36_08815 [Armatimonadetes bacterium]|nr:hypothetical protein [Armatimonadota bacterium]
MTPRERFISALERRPYAGRVPHFELVFFLTMEAFGKVHPSHRYYEQWHQMSEAEREMHRKDMAQLFVDTAERFEHDAIFVHPNPGGVAEEIRLLDAIRDIDGGKYFLMMHGDPTYAIPSGAQMEEMSVRMNEDPEAVEKDAQRSLDWHLKRADRLAAHGVLDGFALCSDYCFNSGCFLPMPWFDRFVTPYLHASYREYRDRGFYVTKHTDGNIMPILDRLVPSGISDCGLRIADSGTSEPGAERNRGDGSGTHSIPGGSKVSEPNPKSEIRSPKSSALPHALHSLDPQGGVDMAEVVRLVGDQVCLCGNVDCGKLQTGTDEECIESARYALLQGMKAPGYIFSTSNCIYTGMELERYELVRQVWLREGSRC